MQSCVYDFCRRTRNTTYQHDNDASSDLDYAMARYYASRSGRFMTPDPGHVGANVGDPQSWNAYVYAGNDPINGVDPLGLYVQRVFDASVCELGRGTLIAQYIGTFRYHDPESGVDTFDTSTTGYDCDFPDSLDNEVGAGQQGGAALNQEQREMQFRLAADRAMVALTDPATRRACGGIFTGHITPEFLLRNLLSAPRNAPFGNFQMFGFQGDFAGARAGIFPAMRGATVVGYVVGINTNPGTFFGRPVNRMAETIIHELGHYYARTFGTQFSAIITPDGNNPDASDANERTVLNSCGLR
jgi:RHS repeat-associated protein